MNRNKNIKAMLAELREEYPIDYETENIRVDVVEGKYTVGTENTINMTVFLKGEKKVFFRVSSFSINDKWLKIFYLNKARNKKHVAIFKVDNPNFIGYGYEPNEVKI